MSTHISSEIEEEIIKKLPVKYVVRCRSVCKAWKALIDSPQFVVAYGSCRTRPQHLLIRYGDKLGVEKKYVSIIDDDTFPRNSIALTVPLCIKQLHNSRIVGGSGGLFCLYGYYLDQGASRNPRKWMAVLWNPSVIKSVAICLPNLIDPDEVVLGFGVCPGFNDPKIVKINCYSMWLETKKITSIFGYVEVFSLRSRTWRSPCGNLPRCTIEFTWSQVVIDEFIYWSATQNISVKGGGKLCIYNLIMSFDMSTEEFREVDLPEQLTFQLSVFLSICKVRESLVVLDYSFDAGKQVCSIWIMKHDGSELFTKLFTIRGPHSSIKALGFRRSSEPIIEVESDDFGRATISIYEPCTEHISNLKIFGMINSSFMTSYVETLLLLN